jgi:hypothetical protein
VALVVGQSLPGPLKPLLAEIIETLNGLSTPRRPVRLFACGSADLPPAEDHPRCLVLISDLNILAHSDGADWIRQDTGAPV